MTLVLIWRGLARIANVAREICKETADLRRDSFKRHPHLIDG